MESRIIPESQLEAAACETCGSGNVLDAEAMFCDDCTKWRKLLFAHILDK